MTRRRIEEQYNDYARRVIPKDAEAVQSRETRQTFFAGAVAVLSILESTSGDHGVFLEIMSEVEAFAEEAVRRAGGRHA